MYHSNKPYRQPRGSSRGGPRGSSREGGFFHRSNPSIPPPVATQRKIRDIDVVHTHAGKHQFVGIKDIECVASYNLTDGHKAPTILVPGKPARWTPPALPQKLGEDGSIYYRDPNSARHPRHPTEPAVRAILDQDPKFKTSVIDIVGCGNTFGSLLSCARSEERTFRFGAERIGNTLFLVRRTNTPGETIEDVRGYGHSFPDAYTTWERDVKGSASHQRIIKYDFVGLKCMIRSETDGYLPEKLPASTAAKQRLDTDNTEDGGVSLTDTLLGFSLGVKAPSVNEPLAVEKAGESIPQQAIFDLKTRSVKHQERLSVPAMVEEIYPRLWANQTPNFVLAFHKWGEFEPSNIHVIDVTDGVRAWESQNSGMLLGLAGLLRELIKFSREDVHGRFEVRRVGRGPLELWSEVAGSSTLPDDLIKRWRGTQSPGADVEGTWDTGLAKRDEEDVGVAKDNDDEADDADYLRF